MNVTFQQCRIFSVLDVVFSMVGVNSIAEAGPVTLIETIEANLLLHR